MEPLKGGVLANIPPHMAEPFSALGKSNHSFSFRWLMEKEGLLTILSGMSNLEQTLDNLEIFNQEQKLSEEELSAIAKVKENILSGQKVPCTGCAYCMPCPVGIDIPNSFKAWNTKSMNETVKGNWISGPAVDADTIKKCIECGKCSGHCPQKINVPEKLKELL